MMRWTSFPYHHISDYIRANVTRSVREAGAEDRGEETNPVQAMEMEAISAGSGQLACGGRYHFPLTVSGLILYDVSDITNQRSIDQGFI